MKPISKPFAQAGVLAAALAGAALISAAAEPAAPDSVDQPKPPAVTTARIRFSPAVAGIVKMIEAKVAPEVIKSYIANSPMTFDLGVEEIIALKNRGVPDDIVTAMLAHDTRLNVTVATNPQTPVAAPSPPPETVPSPASAFNPAYPPYPATYPSVSFVSPIPYGPLQSFNNSKPIWVNGYPVYTGYYVPGYGILW